MYPVDFGPHIYFVIYFLFMLNLNIYYSFYMINKPFFIQINYIIFSLLLCFLTLIILVEIINIRFNCILFLIEVPQEQWIFDVETEY